MPDSSTVPASLEAAPQAASGPRLRGCGGACAGHGSHGLHDAGRRRLFTTLLAGTAAPLLLAPEAARAADPECRRSALAGAVSPETVEGAAQQQYMQMMREAQGKQLLAPADDPQLQRLRYIAGRIVPLTPSCNARARQWRWEVQLLRTNALNAFCMPGGKIAFFAGILSRLKLSDDEVAMIMGHEAAHALLEHAREQLVKSTGTNVGLRMLSALLGLGNLGDLAAQGLSHLASLRFSRDDEGEADALGLLLAARAGYDPRAGISLWQKMGAASGGSAPPAWLSTHPAGPARTREIQQRLARVLPEFERAPQPDKRFPAAA